MKVTTALRPFGLVNIDAAVSTVASTCGDLIEVSHGVIEEVPLVSVTGIAGADLKDLTPSAATKLGNALIAHAIRAQTEAAEEMRR